MAAVDQVAALNAELADCRRELGELRLQLDVLSTIDPLTGLLNRNGVLDALESAADRQRRTSEPFAVLLITVPELIRIRDAYGSLVYADYVRDAGALLGAALRDMDRLGRISESSFLVVMPWMGDDGLPSVSGRLERVLRSRDPGLIPEFTSVAAGPYGKIHADDLLAILVGTAPPVVAG